MFRSGRSRRYLCFILSLAMVAQTLVLAADPTPSPSPSPGAKPDPNGNPKELRMGPDNKFDAAETLTPGDFLKLIKEVRGKDQAEIEKRSWAIWGAIMTNVFQLVDPKATDLPTYEYVLGKVLTNVETVRAFVAGEETYSAFLARSTTFGLTHFSEGNSGFAKFSKNLLNAWKSFSTHPAVANAKLFAQNMVLPEGEKATAFRNWRKGTQGGAEVPKMTNVAGAASIVGTVLLVLAAIVEMKTFLDAKSDDPGTMNWETMQHCVSSITMIALAATVFIPPGPWTVAILAIAAAWEIINQILQEFGKRIQKWHKAYEDSQEFLKETDKKYSAFLKDNEKETRIGENQEIAAALKSADEMAEALKRNPGEGEIAKRHKELVKNLRLQGVLMTYYYQMATQSRDLPGDLKVLEEIWNHRADYMTWKPKPPEKWYNVKGWADMGIDAINEQVRGTARQMDKDLEKYKHPVFFCPDFALLMYFRRFMMEKPRDQNGALSPILNVVGMRIEQVPFTYLPLLAIYKNSFQNWTDDVLREAFAADALCVGSKELPIITEQVNIQKDSLEISLAGILMIWQGKNMDDPKVKSQNVRDLLYDRALCQVQAAQRTRFCLNELVQAYLEDKEQNIKDLTFNEDNGRGPRKVVDELFKGTDISMVMPMADFPLPPVCTGILAGADAPGDDKKTPAYFFQRHGAQLAGAFQRGLNSLGMAGVDVVNMGIHVKNSIDILALAEKTCKNWKEASDALDKVVRAEGFTRLLKKGEYLDVKHSTISKSLSGFDAPKEILDKNIEKFQEGIKSTREDIERTSGKVKDLQEKLKAEYEQWHALLETIERNQEDLGITLSISSSDENYKPELLDFLTPLEPLNPEQDVQ